MLHFSNLIQDAAALAGQSPSFAHCPAMRHFYLSWKNQQKNQK